MKNLLIDEARQWWRLWSVRLAALAGVIAAYLAASPSEAERLLELLPDGPLRTLASVGIGLLVFGLATGARLAKQSERRE
ncbi:MAG TPA: hypothetical protein VNR60_02580 [Croceibacterium sp.]|nr:hypothetical protein [Croceibacterium sp.]